MTLLSHPLKRRVSSLATSHIALSPYFPLRARQQSRLGVDDGRRKTTVKHRRGALGKRAAKNAGRATRQTRRGDLSNITCRQPAGGDAASLALPAPLASGARRNTFPSLRLGGSSAAARSPGGAAAASLRLRSVDGGCGDGAFNHCASLHRFAHRNMLVMTLRKPHSTAYRRACALAHRDASLLARTALGGAVIRWLTYLSGGRAA